MSNPSSEDVRRGNPWGNPLLAVIPPNAQAVRLSRPPTSLTMSTWFEANGDDITSNSPAIRCVSHENCLDSHANDGLANTTEAVGNTSVELLSNDVQSISLNENTSLSPVDGNTILRPSCWELLESVSFDERMLVLDKCTVLELHSLAAVSSRLREGAIASMAKRTLTATFAHCRRYEEVQDKEVAVPIMYIDDMSDPSRSMSVEFCKCDNKEYTCRFWPKFKKLLYFCRFARHVKDVEYLKPKTDLSIWMCPNEFAMKSDHTSNSECTFEEFFNDELIAETCGCIELLKVVSPRFFELQLFDSDKQSDLDALLNSRGILSVESIIIVRGSFPPLQAHITVEQMMKLRASSILYACGGGPIFLTPIEVSQFIEQWVRGRRVIDRFVCEVSMLDNANGTVFPAIKFGQTLAEHLEKLEQPPQIDVSTTFDVEVFSRLQKIIDDELHWDVYGLFDEVSVIHVTHDDGRKITIAVGHMKDKVDDSPLDSGFVYISPSN